MSFGNICVARASKSGSSQLRANTEDQKASPKALTPCCKGNENEQVSCTQPQCVGKFLFPFQICLDLEGTNSVLPICFQAKEKPCAGSAEEAEFDVLEEKILARALMWCHLQEPGLYCSRLYNG